MDKLKLAALVEKNKRKKHKYTSLSIRADLWAKLLKLRDDLDFNSITTTLGFLLDFYESETNPSKEPLSVYVKEVKK